MHEGPRFIWIDGDYRSADEATVSALDRSLTFAESVYEVIPMTHGMLRWTAPHRARMVRAAAAMSLSTALPTVEELERVGEELARREGIDEGVLYLQQTAGSGRRDHLARPSGTPRFFGFLLPHTFPRRLETVEVVTMRDPRWTRSDLKTTMLVGAVWAKRFAERRQAAEALLLGPAGDVREGSTCNVFAVRRGEVWTPPLGSDLLPGITRQIVLEACGGLGLVARERLLLLPDLWEADQVFITSSGKLVTGVASVDGRPLTASGRVGQRLLAALHEALALTPA